MAISMESILNKGYDNSQDPMSGWNHPATVRGIVLTFLLLALACVGLRLYTRIKIIRSPGWEDLFVAIGTVAMFINAVVICIAPNYGLGRHMNTLTDVEMGTFMFLYYIQNGTAAISNTLIKLALVTQYLRLHMFVEMDKMRYMCLGVCGLTAAWGIAYSFITFVPCFPVSNYWMATTDENCYGFGSLDATSFLWTYMSSSIINMLLDIMIFLLPLPSFRRHDTPKKTYIGLLAFMGMSSLYVALSIWRIQTLVQHSGGFKPTFDPTWYMPETVTLIALEIQVSMICAAIPIFWPVVINTLVKVFVTHEVTVRVENEEIDTPMSDEIPVFKQAVSGDSIGMQMQDRGSFGSTLDQSSHHSKDGWASPLHHQLDHI